MGDRAALIAKAIALFSSMQQMIDHFRRSNRSKSRPYCLRNIHGRLYPQVLAKMRVEENCVIARDLRISHHVFRNGQQAGYITRNSTGHYDALPLTHERFDLPESQLLFGSDLYAIAMRLHRIGCTVVPLNAS